MKHSLISIQRLRTIACATATLGAALQASPARTDESAVSTGTTVVLGVTQLTGIIVANGVSSTVAAASGSTAGTTRTTGASEQEKRALAVVVIEDAAQFYATGELTGVLPRSVARMRELIEGSEAAAQLDDRALVDMLVETAEQILESLK